MRVTIKDIAEKAGVSKTTVSFALNRPERISVETRDHILSIVHAMGYVPDPVARTLTTKRLGALGLLLPQPIHDALRNPYLCEIIRGIGSACEDRELSLVMLPPVRGKVIEAARRSFVDGVLTIGVGPDHEVVDLLHGRHIPFVTIDGRPSDRTVNVGIDDSRAAFTLMQHLVDLGHRRIAILGLKPDIFKGSGDHLSLVSSSRLRGFVQAVSMATGDQIPYGGGSDETDPDEGDGCPPLALYAKGDWLITVTRVECTRPGGESAAARLLDCSSQETRPTAIVAMADVVALGVMDTCAKMKMSVPGDVSVAGFDDIPDAVLSRPSLTTLHQPGIEKGVEAARLVLSVLDGNSITHRVLDSHLCIRESTCFPWRA